LTATSLIPTATQTPTFVPAESRTSEVLPNLETLIPTLDPLLARVLTATPDFQNLPTRTVAPPEDCPAADASKQPQFPGDILDAPPHFSYSKAIFEYLNQGGTPQYIRVHLESHPRSWAEEDLTGDGVAELAVATIGLDVFTCSDGQYILGLHLDPSGDPFDTSIVAIQDMNRDEIPELVVQDQIFSAGVRMYRIYEWNGTEFQSLIRAEQDLLAWFYTPEGRGLNWYSSGQPNYLHWAAEIEGVASAADIKDVDGNGTMEFIVHNQIAPVRLRGYVPERETIDTYTWNGVLFLWDEVEIEPPVYRFQAVQDADRMSWIGEYQKALDLYQAVILDNDLLAWSPEHYQEQLDAEGQRTPTPTPIPPIQDEYDNLAAYAHYRMMLLYISQDDAASAQVELNTLQANYPNGEPGFLFSEMASIVWQEYQSSQDLHLACPEVIAYAVRHKDELFLHLGNTLYNISFSPQSHYYTPWDMCPFE
jgi:hypothetical protein